ncbi:dTDP-4-dehydrorhamnose reductase [Dongia sp.]|uniref:dTDP-4-dehydrorhamnose reductase n=1 Tax=Dongia sp. TaxID=1977262 RepID=UPI0035B34D78
MAETVAVIGRNGQLARELADLEWPTGIRPRFLGKGEINLFDAGDIYAQLATLEPIAIVNTAAHTAVDLAQSEPVLATQLNAEAPAYIAAAADLLEIPFLHVSSDYVFSGSQQAAYGEDDATRPLSVYGQSKLAGEKALLASGVRCLIVRSAGLFGRHGQNILKTVLRRASGPLPLAMVADQVSTPTPAAALARILQSLAFDLAQGRALPSHLHIAGQPAVSWFDFAAAAFAALSEAGYSPPCQLAPMRLADLGRPAPRPRNSALDCRLAESLGYTMPDWRAALPALVTQLGKERAAA